MSEDLSIGSVLRELIRDNAFDIRNPYPAPYTPEEIFEWLCGEKAAHLIDEPTRMVLICLTGMIKDSFQ